MPTKTPEYKPDDPEQAKRFIDAAQEMEADESHDVLEAALRRVRTKKPISGDDK